MSHAVIPVPVRFDVGGGHEFALRPGTAVGDTDPGVAATVGRFCAEVAPRPGGRGPPMPGGPGPGGPSVSIQLVAADAPGGPPAALPTNGTRWRSMETGSWCARWSHRVSPGA